MSVLGTQDFARKRRLLNARDFKQVFDHAKRFRSESFLALVTPNQAECSRIGFIIAKRNIAKAVTRNRIRRLARESFRKANGLQQVHLDIVIMVNKTALPNVNQRIVDEYQSLWIKLEAHYSTLLSQ